MQHCTQRKPAKRIVEQPQQRPATTARKHPGEQRRPRELKAPPPTPQALSPRATTTSGPTARGGGRQQHHRNLPGVTRRAQKPPTGSSATCAAASAPHAAPGSIAQPQALPPSQSRRVRKTAGRPAAHTCHSSWTGHMAPPGTATPQTAQRGRPRHGGAPRRAHGRQPGAANTAPPTRAMKWQAGVPAPTHGLS